MSLEAEISLNSSDEDDETMPCDNTRASTSQPAKKKRKAPQSSSSESNKQTLDVVKSLTDSIKSSFEALNKSLNTNFEILGENFNVLSDNMQQFAYPVMDTHSEVNTGRSEQNEGLIESGEHKDDDNMSQKDREKTSEEDDSVVSFLASLEKKSSNREKTGPKINDNLAKNVTTLMRQKPEEDYEKNFLEKIERPENCAGLSTIKVNQVVWDRISAEARTTDVKMQRVQTALVKGTTALTLAANNILEFLSDKDTNKEQKFEQTLNNIWKTTEDALVCLGAANWELAQRRRDLLKSQISKEYSHLCAQKVPFTDMLFGENVTKQIKDITDDNKVTHKLLDQKYGWRRGSRGSARGAYRGRGVNYRGNYTYGRGRFTPYQRPFLGNSNNSRQLYSKGKSTSTDTTARK